MTRRTLPKSPCPECSRPVSVSMVDRMTGPLRWRAHRCVGGVVTTVDRAPSIFDQRPAATPAAEEYR